MASPFDVSTLAGRQPSRPTEMSDGSHTGGEWLRRLSSTRRRRAFMAGRRCLRSGHRIKGSAPVSLRTPYLLFIGDAPDQLAAKTADGIAFWRPEICLGQLRLPGCKADLRLPDMTIDEAAAAGVKTVIVGTTNRGGVLGECWEGLLVRERERGTE